MNKSMRRKILSLIMALVLVLCGTPLVPVYGAGEIPLEELAPGIAAPDIADPEASAPGIADPEVGDPEVTEPDLPPATAESELMGGQITAFSELSEEIRWQNTESPVFPETVEAMLEGNTVEIPVTWEADHPYDAEYPQKGLYVFTAVLGEGYDVAGGVELPRLTVYIPRTAGLMMARMAGSGSADSPLEITTAAQLAEIATLVNEGKLELFLLNNANAKVNLILTKDINLSAYGENHDSGWTSIGTSSNPFKGNFDGDGHVIIGLYINRSTDYQGLFGYINNGSVKHLGVTDAKITGNNNIGCIVGRLESGTVENCYSTGTVSGRNYVGGVAGYVDKNSIIQNCYSTCSVRGSYEDVGGVAGNVNSNSKVQYCYSTGSVINGYSTVGGIAGRVAVNGSVTNCVALNYFVSSGGGRVVGNTTTTLAMNNYAFSGIPGSWKEEVDIAKKNGADVDKETLAGSSFWTTKDNWAEDKAWDKNVWSFENNKLPVLKRTDGEEFHGQDSTLPSHILSDSYFAGSGTSENPYKIETAADLAKLAELVNVGSTYGNKDYRLEKDIDLSSYTSDGGWTPIGTSTSKFKGCFDGNNNKITGIYISTSQYSYQGLFGYIEGGTVKNLGVTGVNIKGYQYVGGLAGYVYSSIIENCYSTGSVSSYQNNLGGVADM